MPITLGHFFCPFSVWRREDGCVFDSFAYDTETTDIDEGRPYIAPVFVVGAACDGRRGVFVSREDVLPFFAAHNRASVVMHNAAFDLKVTAPFLTPVIDIYDAVENNRIWDTMLLQRLLSLATVGHTARGDCSLAACALAHLGVAMQKDCVDAQGKIVRTGFGQFLGKHPAEIPDTHLTYLGQDALATWHLYFELNRRIKDVLRNSHGVWGYVNKAPDRLWGAVSDEWLKDVIRRYGPLTHHVQLRASILMDVLTTNGVGVDQARREQKAKAVRAVQEGCLARMRTRNFLVNQPGSQKAMQSLLAQFHRENPDVELKRTESGERWSTTEEDLADLAEQDSFFRDYAMYRHAEKLLSTYLNKMGPARIHPRFGCLLQTGRTFCSGFTLQNLPTEKDLLAGDPDAATIRSCFVPEDEKVFIDADYGQIELVVLGYALQNQFGLPSRLAQLINDNNDVHRLIAATVMDKDPGAVSKSERNSAKPVSFGRPGGMGVRGLRRVAKTSYGIDLTDEEVKQRIQAYHTLCPELDEFLRDEVNSGTVIAAELQLTPAQLGEAMGNPYDPFDAESNMTAGWLGGMLLKVLREETPLTKKGEGRPYTAEEIAFFWSKAQHLPLKLRTAEQAKLFKRTADKKLWDAVRNWAGRRSVFTVTGRLRANATFCSSRNTIFQGAAADGAILGLWLVWRAGHKIVDFVHDQLVVESPADDKVKERVAEIESLMKQGMAMVVPGMLVKVETVVTASLSKVDLDQRYDPQTKDRIDGSNRPAA